MKGSGRDAKCAGTTARGPERRRRRATKFFVSRRRRRAEIARRGFPRVFARAPGKSASFHVAHSPRAGEVAEPVDASVDGARDVTRRATLASRVAANRESPSVARRARNLWRFAERARNLSANLPPFGSAGATSEPGARREDDARRAIPVGFTPAPVSSRAPRIPDATRPFRAVPAPRRTILESLSRGESAMSRTSAQVRQDERALTMNGPQRLSGQSRVAGAQIAQPPTRPTVGTPAARSARRTGAPRDADDEEIIVRTIRRFSDDEL